MLFEPEVKLSDRTCALIAHAVVVVLGVPMQLMLPSGSVQLHQGEVLGYVAPTAECSIFHLVNR